MDNMIRKMTAADIQAVAEIEKSCFSSPWTREGLLSELSNPQAEFYVLESGGTVAAYMGMHIVLDECYIANVAVSPDFRRKGFGELLVKNALTVAEKKGCCFITLEGRVSNTPAAELYGKCGFTAVGERKNFYTAPVENALIMTKYF